MASTINEPTLVERWEAYIDRADNKATLEARSEGIRGWVPRWMIRGFLQEVAHGKQE